jgi:hypothetical protein
LSPLRFPKIMERQKPDDSLPTRSCKNVSLEELVASNEIPSSGQPGLPSRELFPHRPESARAVTL